ncbi:pyrokinin-1 receptor isoform X2 [Dendroctonus ponderosae]|uniref:G-protein coupled receptors family 1 profile domain-containing protein n=1 Tax=Dendroctonus ponderosae TaxID=77166 RepID=A0AAR5PQS7_DENPD|nr:pyrokinin-1 receptor isoform X2 [Dendroctonus ponderosae]
MSGRLISKGIFRNKSQTEKMELFNETICSEEIYGPKRDELYIVLPISVIYLVIFITGTVGNITTCIVIYRNKSLHTATNYYLFSLAVSDLVLLVSGLPQEIYLIWSRYPYIFGNLFCFLRGLLAETSGNATVLTITGFTVERYLAICHPFLSHTMSKLSRAVKFILLIWFVAISFAIPQALPLKVAGDCPMCLPTEPVMNHSFEISTFVFFVAPMTLITVLYILIGTTLSTSNMMRTRSRSNRVHSKSSRKVIKMLVAVVVAFFICWAPFHVQRLYTIYATFPKPDEKTHSLYLQIYALVTYISGVLYYISATTNPILYSIMSVKFREAFKETFFKCCGLGIQRGKPPKQYSILSRSNVKNPPESTDSAKDEMFQTHTTLIYKNSNDSFPSSTKFKFSLHRLTKSNETHTISEKSNSFSTYASLPVVNNAQNESKLTKISQYFVCLRKNQENGKLAYGNRDGHPSMEFHLNGSERDSCDISNSSLKDIEKGAIEDELGAYINELKSGGI